MKCQHSSADDSALHCIREATTRFYRRVTMLRQLNGSNEMGVYAYVCEPHEEHGPALSVAAANAWAGGEQYVHAVSEPEVERRDPLTDTWPEKPEPAWLAEETPYRTKDGVTTV